MQLEAADAGYGSGRSANFGGIIREGGDVVAVQCHRVRELATGNLHSVARVTGEANDRAVYDFAFGFDWGNFCKRRHSGPKPPLFNGLPSISRGVWLESRMRRCGERMALQANRQEPTDRE